MEPTTPRPAPVTTSPAPAPGKAHKGRKAHRGHGRVGKSKGKAPPRGSNDPLDWLTTRLHADECQEESPVCDVIGQIGPATEDKGVWLGLAIPCVTGDDHRSSTLVKVLDGDLDEAELAGLSIEGMNLNVFTVESSSQEEERILVAARNQVVACLKEGGTRCEIEVEPSLLATLNDPDTDSRRATRDARRHLSADDSDSLDWDLGVGRRKGGEVFVVTEVGSGEAECNWLDVFPNVKPTTK